MKIVTVSGPPCAGKTHHVQTNRGRDDVVIDLDHIAHALGYPFKHISWDGDRPDNHPAVLVALRARASVIKAARGIRGHDDATAWIVGTRAGGRMLADHHVLLDPGRDMCMARAQGRPDVVGTMVQIERWYAAHEAAQPSRDW